jgi:hypothetical protein
MRHFFVAIRHFLRTVRPAGSAAAGGRLANRDLALLAASGLLVMATAPALFLHGLATADPAWPGASPLVLYVIEVGRALGAG